MFQVFASDSDAGENARLYFRIVNGNVDNNLRVDSTTGKKQLDIQENRFADRLQKSSSLSQRVTYYCVT